MNTRLVAKEYRLNHWAHIMKDRAESGMNIKSYCEANGLHTNVYFYWQRKLREAALSGLETEGRSNPGATNISAMPGSGALVPQGWALCKSLEDMAPKTVQIEIGKSRVTVTEKTDHELLSRVCRTLMSLC